MMVSARLSEFVANARFEDLAPRAVEMTTYCILDAVGVSLAASGLSAECTPLIELSLEQGAARVCSILGFAKQASPEAAAFANGALAHALDYEDAHDLALLHPNAPAIPAALAIAEAYGPNTGRELITAIAVGCEVAVRLSLALRVSLSEYGWYPPPIIASFGATAAAAKLLRLDARGVRDAFSILLCQANCSGEIIHSPDSVLRAVRDAFPARSAVTSALLAKRGVRGFELPFEGRAGFFATFARGNFDAPRITDGLGDGQWAIADISFKPWPCCRGTHAAIEAALTLRRAHAIDPAHIEQIRVRGGQLLQMLDEPHDTKRRPRTAIDAKFSLPFTVATALMRGNVELQDFCPAALGDSRVLELAAKVELDSTHALSKQSMGTLLEIRLRDGATREIYVDSPRGSPANPLTRAELIGKFMDCAAHSRTAMSPERAAAAAEALLGLEALPDVRTPLAQYFHN